MLPRCTRVIRFCIRNRPLERGRLFFCANGDDLTINDAIGRARLDKRARKLLFQLVATFRMADQEFDQVKQHSDI
jgi:hypothetical protein